MDTAARDTVIDELHELLSGNGTIPQAQKDRLMLTMIGAIYEATKSIDKSMDDRLKKVEAYLPWLDILKWTTGLIGLSVLALLWGIFTHTIIMQVP